MSPLTDRSKILANLRQTIDNGQLIVGAGAGIGLSAKFIEQGGGDLIIIYNSGRYRMAGRGSLAGLMPYGNANDVVLEMVSFHIVNAFQSKRLCRTPYLCSESGWRSPPNRSENTRSSRCMRNRPFSVDGQVFGAAQRSWLCWVGSTHRSLDWKS